MLPACFQFTCLLASVTKSVTYSRVLATTTRNTWNTSLNCFRWGSKNCQLGIHNLVKGMIMNKQAKCCCGQVKIELEGDAKLNALCHCDNCRKRTGSAFGHSLYFARGNLLSQQGETHTYEMSNEYGEQTRHFCPTCGSTVYWYWQRFPEWVGVAGGCFAESAPSPTVSACHEKALKWVEIPENWIRY